MGLDPFSTNTWIGSKVHGSLSTNFLRRLIPISMNQIPLEDKRVFSQTIPSNLLKINEIKKVVHPANYHFHSLYNQLKQT